MLKINKKHKQKIALMRREIERLSDQQEDIVASLAKDLNINTKSKEFDIFWDHVMNGNNFSVQYTND